MWEISLSGQSLTFVLSVALGICACITFDFLRGWRKVFCSGAVSVFFQDIVYFVIWAVVTFCFMLAYTNGEIRGYIFVGIIIGFIILRITLSRWFLKVLIALFTILDKVIKYTILKKNALCETINAFSLRIFKKYNKICKNTALYLKKLLKQRCKIVYNQDE